MVKEKTTVEGVAKMKVICNRARLAEALGLVSSVAVARSPRPILQCLRMQAEDGQNSNLTLLATDLELGLDAR